jgi:hypothetical protein
MLSVWLALIPVEVSAQGSGVEGAQTTVDDLIQTDAAWDPLLSVTVTIPNTGSVWHCVATGSADAVNPGSGVDNQYRFVLSLDSTSIAVGSACERTIDFNQNAGVNDPNRLEVSSTCTFKSISAGNHSIRWMARKVAASDADLTVDDSSLSVVCSDNVL